MPTSAAVATATPPDDGTPPAPLRAVDPVPTDDGLPSRGCVTVAVDDDQGFVVRLAGALGREGVARVDAVLDALAAVPRTIVVDLSAARTRERRLWRVLTELVGRRRESGRAVVLAGVHPDVVPDLEEASLPEAFLVFRAVAAHLL